MLLDKISVAKFIRGHRSMAVSERHAPDLVLKKFDFLKESFTDTRSLPPPQSAQPRGVNPAKKRLILEKLVPYITGGLSKSDDCYYQCLNFEPSVLTAMMIDNAMSVEIVVCKIFSCRQLILTCSRH